MSPSRTITSKSRDWV